MLHKRFACALAALLAVLCPPAMASDDSKAVVPRDNSHIYPDVAFFGEYAGAIIGEDFRRREVGLQVVALGNGEFEAVVHSGGLPGDNDWRAARGPVRLNGRRHEDSVALEGGPYEIRVNFGTASVYFSDSASQRGRRIAGWLRNVHRHSPTFGACPPSGATVLFDGTNTDQFDNGRMTDDGLLMVGTTTRQTYRDYTLHLEFRLPFMPRSEGQGRGNSGIYLQSRYELQILDSFGMEGADNECGALYKYRKPDVNMCLPPLTWQTYDIHFTSPRYNNDGQKTHDARVTVRHNGVVTHNNVPVTRKTGAGSPEGPDLLPIEFQDHNNPVLFRNIWIVDHDKRGSRCCPTRCEYSRLTRRNDCRGEWRLAGEGTPSILHSRR